MLRVGRRERPERGDRLVVIPRFPETKTFGVGFLAWIIGSGGRGGNVGRCGPLGRRRRFRLGGRRCRLRLRRRRLDRRRRRCRVHPLLERFDPLLLVGLHLTDPGLEIEQAVPVLLALAEHVGHLPLERIEPLVERNHRRLGRRGFIGKARGVRRPALGENLPLHLLHLLFEPFKALVGRRRLALGRGGRGNEREGRTGRDSEDQRRLHEFLPQAWM
ncbi:MAG: hypothetical protein ACJ8LG_19155 [Massilia sp.]